MPIFHLLYRSSASPTIEFKDLEDILLISRMANSIHGVTGLLVYRDHAFLQLIEGEESKVRQLVTNIKKDPRNFKLHVLAEVTSGERLMPSWSMAWVDTRKIGLSSQEFFALMDLCSQQSTPRSPRDVLQLLRDFSEGAQSILGS